MVSDGSVSHHGHRRLDSVEVHHDGALLLARLRLEDATAQLDLVVVQRDGEGKKERTRGGETAGRG